MLNDKVSPVDVPREAARTLWGIHFRSPLMNAAGMFKNAEGYQMVAAQGAGGYLLGTTTARPRQGNEREKIRHPFAPYPRSGSASNWLGLPNEGHLAVAKRVASFEKVDGCPIGASLMTDPGLDEQEALEGLVEGLRAYEDAGVDFLEINESCPNAGHAHDIGEGLARRLAYLQEHFLDKRRRRLPVIVKFSNDTASESLPSILDLLLSLGFDGVNVGNTSTQYKKHLDAIAPSEQALYNFFCETFGGGVSGRPLKKTSLSLASTCMNYLKEKPSEREFHVIRTGGVEGVEDVKASEEHRIALNQWYTGYFESFSRDGHQLYARLYERLYTK
tara:strand:- start:606 stop:1601 length:996 start_codon:yes stop_codon:yes gene_type:complete